jgi:hypothetical protein
LRIGGGRKSSPQQRNRQYRATPPGKDAGARRACGGVRKCLVALRAASGAALPAIAD